MDIAANKGGKWLFKKLRKEIKATQ